MKKSSLLSNDDELFDTKSLSELEQKPKNIRGVVEIKPPEAQVTVNAPSAKEVKHMATKRPSIHVPSTPSGQKKPIRRIKTLVQPPLWSTKPKPPVIIEVPISQTTLTSRSGKAKATAPDAQPVRETKTKSIEEEFDPIQFLRKLRTQAIEYTQKKKYRQLSDLYTMAIGKFPQNPNFHCNRSFAFQKMEYYGKALDDANTAIKINDLHTRAYHRRAAAYLGLGMILHALDDFERLMKLCPKNKKVKCKYLHCQNTMYRCMFKSLLNDNMSEYELENLVSYSTIRVESTYGGPRYTEKLNATFLWSLMKYFRTEGILHRKYVYRILFELESLLKSLPTLINIDITGEEDSLAVCGDIQGQYFDLINIIETNGFPSHKRKYLFNGNFIGKGSFSVEVALLLFSFKIVFPSKFFISRGHHETLAMTKIFGFEKEVNTKYSPVMFQVFTRIFQWLPLAHLINKKILVLHGGLFNEDNVTLEMIKDLPRNMEPTEGDLKLTDILWSDPQKEDGKQKNFRSMGGIMFGPDITEEFLKQNGLEYIIRSHEYHPDGYWEDHDGKCITVFSAPNYCDTYGNKGCYLVLTGKELVKTRTLTEAQYHPDVPALHYADSIYQLVK